MKCQYSILEEDSPALMLLYSEYGQTSKLGREIDIAEWFILYMYKADGSNGDFVTVTVSK
jgi:hypothetical protein